MNKDAGQKRGLVRERMKRIVQSSEKSDGIVKVLIGILVALLVFLIGYFAMT